MKIAICYSGNIRTFEYCVKNHSSLLEKCDVYFSVWEEFGFSDRINDPSHIKIERTGEEKVTEKYIIEKTPSNFNIKNIIIEKYEDVEIKKIENNQGISYQYYKIKSCYDSLLWKKENYDYVIRLRPDIIIDNFHFEEGKIIFDHNIWKGNIFREDKKSINEMIWISNMDLMYKSCKIYDNIESILSSVTKDFIYGESISFNNLIKENLLEFLSFRDFNYNVIR
jgi:hypothetical protein